MRNITAKIFTNVVGLFLSLWIMDKSMNAYLDGIIEAWFAAGLMILSGAILVPLNIYIWIRDIEDSTQKNTKEKKNG